METYHDQLIKQVTEILGANWLNTTWSIPWLEYVVKNGKPPYANMAKEVANKLYSKMGDELRDKIYSKPWKIDKSGNLLSQGNAVFELKKVAKNDS